VREILWAELERESKVMTELEIKLGTLDAMAVPISDERAHDFELWKRVAHGSQSMSHPSHDSEELAFM
jgi:hypothetical protein